MSNIVTLGVIAAVFMAGSSALAGAAEPPKAANILFETPHIAPLTPGTDLVYRFDRKPSDEKVLGKAFSDDITVKIEGEGAAAGKKNVLVQVYSGEYAREPQRITDMDGNPMLIVYLDNAVAHFRELAGGDRVYLKNMFSKNLGESAKVDAVTIDFKGEKLPGYRITVSPYVNDPARSKMRGFEGATFTITTSEKIPGYLAQMISKFPNNQKDGPSLEEVTTLSGVGGVQ